MLKKPHPYLIRLFLILIFVAVVGGVYFFTPSKTIGPKEPTSTPQNATEQSNTIPATISVLDKTYPVQIDEGSSVYDAMQSLMKQGLVSFTAKEYSGMGYLIEEFNGTKNDNASGTYWVYYINGKSADEGISSYIIKPNDTISWKYEKSIY